MHELPSQRELGMGLRQVGWCSRSGSLGRQLWSGSLSGRTKLQGVLTTYCCISLGRNSLGSGVGRQGLPCRIARTTKRFHICVSAISKHNEDYRAARRSTPLNWNRNRSETLPRTSSLSAIQTRELRPLTCCSAVAGGTLGVTIHSAKWFEAGASQIAPDCPRVALARKQ